MSLYVEKALMPLEGMKNLLFRTIHFDAMDDFFSFFGGLRFFLYLWRMKRIPTYRPFISGIVA